jgi:hypothetical protein
MLSCSFFSKEVALQFKAIDSSLCVCPESTSASGNCLISASKIYRNGASKKSRKSASRVTQMSASKILSF